MYVEATIYAIPLLIGATVALTFCFLALQRYQESGALAFMIGMASVAMWSFAYAFEIMAPTVEDKLPWHRIIYSTSATVPAFWLLFLVQHEYGLAKRTKLWAILLSIEPILYIVITWTNDVTWNGDVIHTLLWRSITLNSDGGLPRMIIERAPGFYLHVAFTYVLVLISVILFLRMLRRESSTLSTLQIILLLLGILSPVVANTLHIAVSTPFLINLTPFSLITMGATVGWFAFRFDLWDILPVAHDAVIENLQDGVVVLNLNHVIIDINPAACQLLNVDASTVTGRRIDTVITESAAVELLRLAIGAGESQLRRETELLLEEPRYCVLEVIAADLFDRRRRLNGQILTLREITARRAVEKELARERRQLAQRVAERTAELSRANAELAAAARLKDEFLANMSHELRTPLNTILGLSEALQEEIYGQLSPLQNRPIQHVLDAGRHLLALINDILDVSKIEAGKFSLELGPVAVDSLCQSSVNFIKQEAERKALSITVDTDPTVQLIFADERRVKQILVNLLNNAVKFTSTGGRIGLEVRGEPFDEVVYFKVWDTGIGIAAADMAALFNPFVQLDSRLTRQHEGTGLGLALVHRMVELHGGSVRVESAVDVGTTFIVALPWPKRLLADGALPQWPDASTNWMNARSITSQPLLQHHLSSLQIQATRQREGEADLPMAVSGQQDGGAPAHVKLLLVEDNETNIRTFSDYLATVGYELEVTRSGTEALTYLRDGRPDLILLDIQMPGMDGWEVARRIRQMAELRTVPIIALTALAMPGDRERCLEAGMDEYLSKPVSLRQLRSLIETYLAAHSEQGCDPTMAL
ncbi:MAG TPA: histidine kinase N-terminal 7TM domain-containing protein [Caldilineaceae bacterium]|nr:histidine kinase N-terminal 7TM domain-containing protein [Caldilineaceae bacterium]